MLFLTIVSFGIYPVYYIWEMKQTTDALPTKKKMNGPLLMVYFGLVSIQIPFSFISNFEQVEGGILFFLCGLNIAVFLVVLLILFDLEDLLTEYLKTEKAIDPDFEGFWAALCTFLFGIFYVQYKINQVVVIALQEGTPEVLFPLTVRCLTCKGKIVVEQPGTWRCPVCKSAHSTDPNGRVRSRKKRS